MHSLAGSFFHAARRWRAIDRTHRLHGGDPPRKFPAQVGLLLLL